MKVAIVPTMPSRIEYLKHAVLSIVDQVDLLYVYLNNFTHTPEYLIGNEKIICINGKDWGSAGRFFMSDKVNGYYFMLDDDLIYPSDYVEKMIAKIEQYKRKAIITLHGRILKQPLKDWFTDQVVICRCLDYWSKDREIHVGGTGVMAYHTDTIKIKLDEFKNRNLDDVEFSLFAQAQKVPTIAVNHERGFLVYQTSIRKSHTIWSETVKNPEPLVSLAQSIEWKLFGIKAENGGILLKASKAVEWKKKIKPLSKDEEKFGWRKKMRNLMRRREEYANKPRPRVNETIRRYDVHISKIKIGKKVLDVGCGSMVIKGFLPSGTKYIGIDAYPVGPGVRKMEIEKCTFPNLHFDTTFAFAVLDSVYNLNKALAQIARVTKKNILILTGLDIEPNEFHTYKITEDMLNKGLIGFGQGFKEYFGPRVGLIEYVRI